MLAAAIDVGQIIMADLILSGDNALIIGMAAAGLTPKLRRRAIFLGILIAALLRIVFAVIATSLLAVPGLLLIGALLLFWVCWRLFTDIRAGHGGKGAQPRNTSADAAGDGEISPNQRRQLIKALWSITIADISMSLDNVLAVAAIADGNVRMLVFGLGLAIALMAFAATIIMRILTRYPWISWLGLAVLVYVSTEMLYKGLLHPAHGVIPLLGWGSWSGLGAGH